MPGDTQRVQLTVEEKICFHLLKYHHLKHEFVLPQEISQTGIARSVRVQRGHASVALISLKKKALIEERVSRVRDNTRRKKVYFLTDTGLEEAMKIKKMAALAPESSTPSHAVSPPPSFDSSLTPSSSLIPPQLSSTSSPYSSAPSPSDPSQTSAPFSSQPSSQPPHHLIRSTEKFSAKQKVLFIGFCQSFFSIYLLWFGLEKDNDAAIFFSLILVIFVMISLNSFSFNRSPQTGKVEMTFQDMVLLVYSLIILIIVLQSSVDDEFHSGEILQAGLVILPLLLLLHWKSILSDMWNVTISGIGGSLIILYGSTQTIFSMYPGEMHYPVLWVLGGFLIFIQGYFAELPSLETPMDGINKSSSASSSPFTRLLISSCQGVGLFILISLISLFPDISFDGLTVALVVLWLFYGFLLLFIGFNRKSAEQIVPLLLSSVLMLTGVLFFFAAGVFFSMDKYIEGAMEVLVSLIILRFSLNYCTFKKLDLLYNAVFVVVGLLSVYELYSNI